MFGHKNKTFRILVVEDDPVTLLLYRKVFNPEKNESKLSSETNGLEEYVFGEKVSTTEELSFQLVTCKQGEEAVMTVSAAVMEKRPFSVVFLDILMPPGPDGIWTAEQIRSLDPNIEIVMVTASIDIDLKEISRRIQPVHKLLYIQKPFHLQEIYQFASALSSKWSMERELHDYQSKLEVLVMERTGELIKANRLLEQEITERKRSEEDLAKSKELFSKAFYSVPVPMTISSVSDGKLLLANDAWMKLMGFDHQNEVIGKPEAELGCWFDLAGLKERNRRLRETGSCRELEIQVQTHKGDIRHCIYSAEEIEQDGKTCVLSMAIDFTERTRAEGALRQSEEKYRDLVESANSIILRWDIEGNITYLNPYGLELFGFNLDEIIGRNVVGTIIPESESETKRALISLMKDIQKNPDKYKHNENENIRKDGTGVWISWTNRAVLDKSGNTVEILSIGNNIDEKKRLETRLLQAEKMEAIGTLAGGVAHDLNNVLAGIVSYPELLLGKLPEDSPLRTPILTIQESGEKAAAIVQDLLTLSRRGVSVSEVVDLNSVINKYLKSPEYEKLKSFHPHVEVETHLDKGLSDMLGSPVHLSKTIMNLVSNAAEAMPEGGKLSISTKNHYRGKSISYLDGLEQGDYVVVTITDTGTGISSEDMERIFEPFFTKKKMGKSGTGLGMAVVWGTVKDHNGHIDVQSRMGKGTTLTLYFPATKQKRAQEQLSSPAREYAGNGETILVVDDLHEQREIAYAMLSELDYSVTAVSSGEEAVNYLKENMADLLVLDMVMDEGMDGLDTYKEILKIHPEQKAIIASGYSETARIKEAERLGVGQYIQKPYSLEKIGKAIKAELCKSKGLA